MTNELNTLTDEFKSSYFCFFTLKGNNLMHVSLSALKAFESAARLGSFKAAAAELSISPTAVSHHINNLEDRLSVTLFVRATKKVTLSEIGQELAAGDGQGFQMIDTVFEKITEKTIRLILRLHLNL